MLDTAQLAAFSATANPDLARSFYRDTLGLTFVSEDPFALVFDANGTVLRVQKVRAVEPQPYTRLGWRVDDIEAVVRDLSGRGVTFLRYDFMAQDELGIWSAPGGAKVAWFNDPDGNILSVAADENR
jgi:catechol 2,3-dioxygenase-like lactoylglutathione lyase family enzyme